MRIKIGDDYLEFNESITVDKQSFLFEEIDAFQGDRSYSFNIPITSKNLSLLGIQSISILSKSIYNQILCSIESDLNVLYYGYIKVERVDKFIEAAFFTGNYEWINEIDSVIKDLDFSSYDVEITTSNITSSVSSTGGQLVFPLIDRGALGTRASARLYTGDFQPFIFVKDVIGKISEHHNIKITGELINDALYNKLIVSSQPSDNSSDMQALIDARTCYVGITSPYAGSGAFIIPMVDNSGSFFDGSANLWNNTNYRYTADYDMIIEVEVISIANASGDYEISVVGTMPGEFNIIADGETYASRVFKMHITSGTYINFIYTPLSGQSLTTCTVRITPIKIYRTSANTLCGNMSSIVFIQNIFSIFKVVPEYDISTRTITANLFERVQSKQEVDVSEYVTTVSIDFDEFVSSYGRKSWLKYSAGSEESLTAYNDSNTTEYGSNYLEVNNDFIVNEEDAVVIDFIASRTNYIPCIGAYLPTINFAQIEEQDSTEVLSNTSTSGELTVFVDEKFWNGADGLYRLSGFSGTYNKDWHTDASVVIPTTGYIIEDSVAAGSTEDLTITRLLITDTGSDDVVIMVYEPSVSVSDISTASSFFLYGAFAGSGTTVSTIGYAYFVKPSTNADTNFTQSIAFGLPNDPNQYQSTIKDTYFRSVERILNDPVKVKATAYLPYSIFLNLSSHNPIRLNFKNFNEVFYLNKISGYRGSKYPCLLELIKL